jgi:hypothetical protein
LPAALSCDFLLAKGCAGSGDPLGFSIAAVRFLQCTAKDAASVEEGDAVRGARRMLLEGGEGGMQLQLAA